MPIIRNFDGNTFVAFMDISGFKEMMKRGDEAWEALNNFYNIGYFTLKQQNLECEINGIFISDCGVLFARSGDPVRQLRSILNAVQKINRDMLEKDVMLKTSSDTNSSDWVYKGMLRALKGEYWIR